jgi:hypothetical protein
MNNQYISAAERNMTNEQKIKHRLNLIEREPHWKDIETFLIKMIEDSEIPVPGIQVAPDGIVQAYWFWPKLYIQIQIHFDLRIHDEISLKIYSHGFSTKEWTIIADEYAELWSPSFTKLYGLSQHDHVKKIISGIYSYVI